MRALAEPRRAAKRRREQVMRKRWTIAAMVLGLLTMPAAAQDSAAVDKLVADALKEMHNKAADLYNAGDANGCYRMFQGGLYTARALLGHRPDVQTIVDRGLEAAERQAAVPARAMALHNTIEAVRAKLKPPAAARPADTPAAPLAPVTPTPMPPGPTLPAAGAPGAPAPPTPPSSTPPANSTLWKRLGGEDGVTRIVDKWLTLALANEKAVNFTRGDKYKLDDQKVAALKQKFVAYVSAIAEGNYVPTATPNMNMAEVHKGMNITPAEFDAFVECLRTALLADTTIAARDRDDLLQKVIATKKDMAPGG
jgi:truncated hemoglobin YjbI